MLFNRFNNLPTSDCTDTPTMPQTSQQRLHPLARRPRLRALRLLPPPARPPDRAPPPLRDAAPAPQETPTSDARQGQDRRGRRVRVAAAREEGGGARRAPPPLRGGGGGRLHGRHGIGELHQAGAERGQSELGGGHGWRGGV